MSKRFTYLPLLGCQTFQFEFEIPFQIPPPKTSGDDPYIERLF